MVVKPSDHTPVTALELARLVTEAGIPDGVFDVITGNGPDVGRALVRHPGVDKVAFTGSTRTGIDVAEGATSHLARVTLELGGKSAQVVFPDADLEAAANGVIAGVFAATGQTCMAGSRLIVHADVHDELVERVAARAREIVLGNPLEEATEMGPLANAQQFEKVTGILAARWSGRDGRLRRRALGPRRLLRRSRRSLTGVDRDSPAVREEIFGPVVAAMTFTEEDEAVALANDTEYGLAGVGVDAGHPPRDARRPASPSRHGVGQRLPRRRPERPVRRLRRQRHRARERLRRPARVHRDALDLDRDLRRDPGSLHLGLTDDSGRALTS